MPCTSAMAMCNGIISMIWTSLASKRPLTLKFLFKEMESLIIVLVSKCMCWYNWHAT